MVFSVHILSRISVGYMQNLRVSPDVLQNHSGYTESVSQGTIPVAFGFLDF